MSDWYICHHGIKGQRWGRRRWQNEDGSLTSAGMSRYMDGVGGFRWGEHAGERPRSRMNPVARVVTAVGRATNAASAFKGSVERIGKIADTVGKTASKIGNASGKVRSTVQRAGKRKKMSPDEKKALAKKIAIGVGAVGVAAAAAYGLKTLNKINGDKKLLEFYNGLQKQKYDRAVKASRKYYDSGIKAGNAFRKRGMKAGGNYKRLVKANRGYYKSIKKASRGYYNRAVRVGW